MMYLLDLFGTLAFAITGAYKAKRARLHIFGVIFLAIITAVGGGTMRDLIIGRSPLFYLNDPNYFFICILGGIITYITPTFFKKKYSFFRFIDSIGLSVFVIIGVSISFGYLFFPANNLSIFSFLICVFLGMLTGFGGGIIRDAIMGDTPMSLKHGSNYAFSAFCGASIFYLLMLTNINAAIIISIATTIILREIVSKYGIYKKIIIKNKYEKNN